MGYLVSLLVLSGLIFFHELGHFTAARLMGVYVEVFSIGFGKRLFTFKAFSTEWSISAIPLGGYVRMKGQDDTDPSKKIYAPDSYNSKTPLQRIFILAAGPLANFVLAFILYFAIALGNPSALAPVVGDVVKDSPAFVAGLKSNDTILSINGKKVATWKEMAELIKESKGAIALEVDRKGYLKLITLTPKLQDAKNMYGEDIKRKMIGVSAAGVMKKRNMDFFQKLEYATDQTVFASTLIFTGVKKLIFGEVPASEMGGVISIVKLTSDATDAGWMSVLFFAALISVNLGVLNLLPIPALDGGHIMFNLYELLFRREPSEKILVNLTIAGWVILFGLMGLGLFNDINRIFGQG
ncbi:RIP metalloprotease RseP [Sulfurimonas paralvinellae]|uniref:Zinc metalloprotease n=1 Tax=Sulfurimonas paralvinellae TaxID=317658 RepID=A0A7M1B938_9BACT|nr:RIP metalloprotease RseP [Sulfurimonas paralvinellae]QOP45936.1 RIP metalloprotease RseP [Sulfurimonas paralvinellae]